MKKNVNAMTFVIMLCVSLILVGCGTTQTNVGSTQVTATKTFATSNNGSVEVIEYSSPSIGYNGEHGARGRKDDSITAKISVDKDGIITAVSNSHDAGSPKSQSYQSRFESAIGSKIIGKNIKDLDISVVGGASTTSEAFNAALDSIRTQISGS